MIAVVDSGSGNLRSVAKALAAAGGAPVVTSDPDVVRRADRVVVPGQGAFRDCMDGLRRRGLEEAVREAIRSGRPYLGICLGLQVLFDESDEHGPCAGLGILPGRVVRFERPGLKVPHMGWNQVLRARPDPILAAVPDEAYVYFVHSYYVVPARDELAALWCDYGGRFCAAVRHANVFATQFHPEKSQKVGLALLSGFVTA
ncbi:MAG TPA: imidazole glycerol phosphate synthase subunit HisH [Haliangiales bacterium]|nr:imidazole glycerol phosphate synthase subunit HisH [Haliangiales bacterium]